MESITFDFTALRARRGFLDIDDGTSLYFPHDGGGNSAAEIVGGLFDEDTRSYRELFERRVPAAIKRWKNRPGMIILRIKPKFVVTGGGTEGRRYLDCLDLEKKIAYA